MSDHRFNIAMIMIIIVLTILFVEGCCLILLIPPGYFRIDTGQGITRTGASWRTMRRVGRRVTACKAGCRFICILIVLSGWTLRVYRYGSIGGLWWCWYGRSELAAAHELMQLRQLLLRHARRRRERHQGRRMRGVVGV